MKITLLGYLFIFGMGIAGWMFSDSLTMPRVDNPNLYELTRQTADNTRWIAMLLFMFATTGMGILITKLHQNRTD